jgi:exopolysaccharide production protein ExoZ
MSTLLQAARFGAALVVVLFHCHVVFSLPKYFSYTPLDGLFTGGTVAVDFFFVLSGFIIFTAHAKDIGQPDRLRRYLTHRAVRIYPTYWIILLSVVLPLYFVASPFGGDLHHPWYMIRQVLLLQTERPVITVSWTLTREVFFYALFATLIINRSLGCLVLGAWFLASATIAGGAIGGGSVVTDPRNLQFLIGMTAAFLMLHHKINAPRALLALGSAGLAACAIYGGLIFGNLQNPAAPNLTMTAGLAAAAIICALVELERSAGWRAAPALRYLGDASYAIYLVHMPVLTIVVRFMAAAHLHRVLPMAVLFCLAAAASVGSGAAFYRIVETPLRRVLKRATARRLTTPSTSMLPLAEKGV